MAHEIEVKFKLRDFRDLRRRLAAAGAEHLFTLVQTDTYYDTPDGRLLARDCGLRIRRVRAVRKGAAEPDLRPQLTAKGPRGRGAGAKVRPEVQCYLDDPRAVEGLLLGAGLTARLKIQKRRESYRLGKSLVELDQLPLIGRFVEIESPSRRLLEQARKRAGLEAAEPICDHYVSLLKASGGARQREFLL